MVRLSSLWSPTFDGRQHLWLWPLCNWFPVFQVSFDWKSRIQGHELDWSHPLSSEHSTTLHGTWSSNLQCSWRPPAGKLERNWKMSSIFGLLSSPKKFTMYLDPFLRTLPFLILPKWRPLAIATKFFQEMFSQTTRWDCPGFLHLN